MRGVVLFATVGVLLAAARTSMGQEAGYRRVITSARTNLRSTTFDFGDDDVPEVRVGPWSVRQKVLHGGKQEGVEVLTIYNGKMTITLIPTRGLSVLEARAGDLRLGWDSPVKEVVHPRFMSLEGRGGLGWLEGFNEGLVRCGLEFAGQPGRDEFVTNTGAKATMELTLHGKIGNIPASEVEVVVDRTPPHRIRVRGVVHERMFFGPKLELATEVSTVPGSLSFQVDDAVTNRGAGEQEFQLIYHANFGAPLLEKGATVVAPVGQIAPRNEHAAGSISEYGTYDGPTAGFVEQVYLITPLADDRGRTVVLLRDANQDRGTSISWNAKELPFLTLWKNTGAREDGYVTGLEPGTGFPYNRRVERQAGRVPKLAPGETRRFSLDFALLPDRASVARAADRIAQIQKGHEPRVETKPPAVGD